MSTRLNAVITGKLKNPILMLEYGPDGVGKSTVAAKAPNSIFLGTEQGTANLNVARFPEIKTFEDALESIRELIVETHNYETLVIDSLDWLEPLVWDHVCKENKWDSIEQPGFGRGYVLALRAWRKMIEILSELRAKKGMNIVLIAHSQIKPFHDPNLSEPYDRHVLKLNDKASALFREWVDMVLFANFRTFVTHDGKRPKGISDDSRWFYSQRTAAYDAKNRMGLAPEFKLSWDELMRQIARAQPEDPEKLRNQIKERLNALADQGELKSKVLASVVQAQDDPLQLTLILNKLDAKTQLAST